MRKLKTTLALLLVIALAGSMFAGCGSQKVEPQPQTQESEPAVSEEVKEPDHSPITYTIAGPGSPENIWSETHQFKWYKENLGITFDGGVTSEFDTKLQLWMADDDLPDVMTGWCGFTRSQFTEWAKEGFFLNLADHLDVMPNFKAFLEEHPDYKNFVTLDDGGIYGLARYNSNPTNGLFTPTYLRADLLKEAGLEIPTTIDEMYDVLTAFKNMGVEYPLSYAGMNGDETTQNWLAPSFGMPNGTFNDSAVRWVEKGDGTIDPAITTDNYKAYLKYMNKLYENGLIVKEAYSLTSEQYDAIITDGRFGLANAYQSLPGTAQEKTTNYVAIPALTSEFLTKPSLTMSPRLTSEFFFMISADIEDPERICELIDFCFTPDGYNIARWGVEGQSYDIKQIGDAKLVDTTKYEAEYKEKGVTNFDAIRRSFDTFSIVDYGTGGSFAAMDVCKDDSTLLNPDLVEIAGQNILRQKMLNDNKDIVLVNAYPGTSPYISDTDRYATLETDICSYMASIEADFVTGTKDIDEYWDKYIETLNKIGLPELVEMEQSAYTKVTSK